MPISHVVHLLLESDVRGSRLLDICDRDQNTPLHAASERGFINIVVQLIEAGADVDRKNEDEQTPLHVAAKEGRTK